MFKKIQTKLELENLPKSISIVEGNQSIYTKPWFSILMSTIVFLMIAAVFLVFTDEIKTASQGLIQQYGLISLFIIVMIMDSLLQPVSPDFLIMSYSLLDQPFIIAAIACGLASVIAGVIGYRIGMMLDDNGIERYLGQRKYQKAYNIFQKYGIFAVIIGALSPFPYSLICWSAGIFKMHFPTFLISAFFTRIPRFIFIGYVASLF